MFKSFSEDVSAVMGANAPVAFVLVFIATAFEFFFLLGLFVPGVVIVAAAGALVGAGRLPLYEVLLAASAGSFAGTVASFALGRRLAGRSAPSGPSRAMRRRSGGRRRSSIATASSASSSAASCPD